MAALFASLRRRARKRWGVRGGQCGAVTFVQRFGSAAANLNPHFHTLALDGVYEISRDGPTRFHPLPPPDAEEVAQVVAVTARRVALLLAARGLGPGADPDECDPLVRDEPLLATLAAASLQGRIATGPRAGQRLLRLGDRVEPDELAASDVSTMAPRKARTLLRVERAGQVTLRRLCDDVDAVIASGNLDPAALPALPAGLQGGARHKDSEDTPGRPEERDRLSLWAPEDVARLFRAAHATVQRRIGRAEGRPCTPGEALEVMLRHVGETWRLRSGGQPREHRIMQRDGWRCTVPGCTSYRNLHVHHVVFRSAGGSDAEENLTTLCAAHHQRGVHGGGPGPLRISGRAPAALRFELPLESFAAGDVRLGRGQG